MSSPIVSKWPVLITVPIGSEDTDGAGELTDKAVERLFAGAREAYFDLCKTVDPSAITVLKTTIQRRSEAVSDAVSVSVNVAELLPDSFTMAARMRPTDRDDIAADAWCSISPGGELTKEMRDEFIALAHAARHWH